LWNHNLVVFIHLRLHEVGKAAGIGLKVAVLVVLLKCSGVLRFHFLSRICHGVDLLNFFLLLLVLGIELFEDLLGSLSTFHELPQVHILFHLFLLLRYLRDISLLFDQVLMELAEWLFILAIDLHIATPEGIKLFIVTFLVLFLDCLKGFGSSLVLLLAGNFLFFERKTR